MSITSVTLVDRKSEVSSDGSKKLYRTYQIATTDPVNDDETVVLEASDGTTRLPKKGDSHPGDDTMWVDTITCTPFEDRVHWRAEVAYVRKPGGKDGYNAGGGSNDPWDMPAQITYFAQKEQVALKSAYKTGDTRGNQTKPVVNSAGDPFFDPIMIDKAKLGIRIQRNERDSSFDPNVVVDYVDTLNDVAIRIAGILIGVHEGRMMSISPAQAYTQDGDLYWQVTYEILIDRDSGTEPDSGGPAAWMFAVCDQGFYKVSGSTKEKILDSNSLPVADAQKLNGSGQPLAFGATTAHWEYFQGYWSGDIDGSTTPDWFSLKLPKNRNGTGFDTRG